MQLFSNLLRYLPEHWHCNLYNTFLCCSERICLWRAILHRVTALTGIAIAGRMQCVLHLYNENIKVVTVAAVRILEAVIDL